MDAADIPGTVTAEEESALWREAQSFGVDDALAAMRHSKQRMIEGAVDAVDAVALVS